MAELLVLDTAEQVAMLRDYLKDFEFVAYDSETTGLLKSSEVIGFSVCAEESCSFYVILSKWDKEQGIMASTGLYDEAVALLQDLQGKKLIMHNAVFDCRMAEAFFKVRLIDAVHTDTMVMAHLLNENRSCRLKDLGEMIFGGDAKNEEKEMKASAEANGAVLTKKLYEMYKADPYILGRYGAQDTLLTFRLFNHFVPQLFAEGLDKFFYEEESMPQLRTVTYDLNNVGLRIDVQKLDELRKTLEMECAEAEAFVNAEIAPLVAEKYPGTNKKNKFNIGSSSQLAWLLFGKLDLDYGPLTDEGKNVCKSLGLSVPYTRKARVEFLRACLDSSGSQYALAGTVNGKAVRGKKVKDPWAYIKCDKSILQQHAKTHRWIARLLEYQSKRKLLTTYVKGIQERLQYGIIQPGFMQHGTTSGRYSSQNPNFQNLPRDDKRIKACIVPRPGKVFVGADYSQLEPRVFAYLSQDENLMAAFNSDKDFYSVIGMDVYDKTDCTPHKDGSPDAFGIKYKGLRDLSKVIALASVYGASAFRLASTTKKSVADTERDIESYFERFPNVRKLMLDSHKQAKKQGFVTNIFGRKRRMPEALKFDKIYGPVMHDELPYEVRGTLNLSTNHRIQSTGASIVNRAAIRLYELAKEFKVDMHVVLQVHDSIVVECFEEDAPGVVEMLRHAMEQTVILEGVPLEALPKTGKDLSEV